MKWETIKNRCINQASRELTAVSNRADWGMLLTQLIKEGNPMNFHNAQKTAKEKCYEIIDNWDIRQWKNLKFVFPDAFPSGLNQPELTDKGWELL